MISRLHEVQERYAKFYEDTLHAISLMFELWLKSCTMPLLTRNAGTWRTGKLPSLYMPKRLSIEPC